LNKKVLSREFKGNVSELRKIFKSLELMPDSPTDEFDYLIHKILSQLTFEIDSKKITNIIQSELVVYYGLFIFEFDSSSIAVKIIDWWNSKM
jgi:hypothetical protein